MAINLIPDREHLKVGEHFARPEFTAAQVRKLRDEDRRRYRRDVILLVLYQIAILGPVRYAIDFMLQMPGFQWLSFIKPYIIIGMVVAVVLIWTLGLFVAFRRRY